MGRVFFDHTGDVGVRLTALSLGELFRQAALAFTETVTDPSSVEAATVEQLTLAAATLEDLMVEWLNELLYRFEVCNVLTTDADPTVAESDGAWTLVAQIQSEPFDPHRHPIKVLVKGVTYHQLDIHRVDGGWETSVVFDI